MLLRYTPSLLCKLKVFYSYVSLNNLIIFVHAVLVRPSGFLLNCVQEKNEQCSILILKHFM